MRDTMIFYRSFYEAIKELPPENKIEVYDAIFSYSLDFSEPDLSGISKTIFTLIKPQLDANIKRFENGKKPKQKQKESETEAKQKQKESETEAKQKQKESETEAKQKQKESKTETNNNNNVNNNNNNNKNINVNNDEEENFFEDENFEKKEEAKNFLKTAKPSQIDRLRMQHKLSVEHYNEKVDEFVDKKFDWGENSKWKNEDDMSKNFEFWLPSNYKRVVNPYKQWTEEDFRRDCAKHMKTFGKYVLNKFYNHFRQKTPTGEMLFQSRNAWNTEAQLKNWCNENLKKQNNI